MNCERCGTQYNQMQAVEQVQVDIYEKIWVKDEYEIKPTGRFKWVRKKLCPKCAAEMKALLDAKPSDV